MSPSLASSPFSFLIININLFSHHICQVHEQLSSVSSYSGFNVHFYKDFLTDKKGEDLNSGGNCLRRRI